MIVLKYAEEDGVLPAFVVQSLNHIPHIGVFLFKQEARQIAINGGTTRQFPQPVCIVPGQGFEFKARSFQIWYFGK